MKREMPVRHWPTLPETELIEELLRGSGRRVAGMLGHREGPSGASQMLIGEQPGDQEDRSGRPVVGPAGQLLDEALSWAAIDRREIYVTNTVKHFKFQERGKRRLHQKPHPRLIEACRPWLEAEIDAVAPRVIVCLGATAATTILGRDFRITRHRGQWKQGDRGLAVLATWHPAAILRAPDPIRRAEMVEQFRSDLDQAWRRARAV